MEKVSGFGGFFFRARDPDSLAKWYSDNLGISQVPDWCPDSGTCAFTPFPEDTSMFGDEGKNWMLNFRVRNLDEMVEQLRKGGISVEVDKQTYPYGRFASLADPEGNPIQLWEPADKTPSLDKPVDTTTPEAKHRDAALDELSHLFDEVAKVAGTLPVAEEELRTSLKKSAADWKTKIDNRRKSP